MATEGVRYIKIARIDKNGIDQTNTLQSLNQITIPYTSGDIVYTVVNITEKPTFFLYYVNPAEVDWSDRADIKYDFTGSLTSTFHPAFDPPVVAIIDINAETDNLGFLTDKLVVGNSQLTGSFYKIDTYPQKSLYIRASGSISITDIGTPPPNYTLTLSRGNTTYPNRAAVLDSLTIPSSGFTTQSFDLSFSEPSNNSIQPGDSYYLQIAGSIATILTATTLTSDSQFFVTSSNATNNQVGLIAEPYFGSNDFNRALDCQPLLNNAERVRKHNLYQDVDYSAGATEPVNFDLLISGSAVRADVQFSNYTTRRHIIPRYEGSKSTSQNLNTWTKGDSGTFGKTPTLDSLKTVIAYCDWIGGWPPDRMNTSTAHVLYLIDSDGNIGVPNTSENSLPNVQGSFQTGEKFRISSRTIGSGPTEQFRTVIRGGQRIEPILYTQSGSAPLEKWVTSINFTEINPATGGTVANVQNNGSIKLQEGAGGFNPWFQQRARLALNPGDPNSTLITSAGTFNTVNYSKYTVPATVITENITLKFVISNIDFKFALKTGKGNGAPRKKVNPDFKFRFYWILKKNSGETVGVFRTEGGVNYQDIILTQTDKNRKSNNQNQTLKFTKNRFNGATAMRVEIDSSQLLEGDDLFIEYFAEPIAGGGFSDDPNLGGVKIIGGSYSITQQPIPTIPVDVDENKIWGFYDKTNYPYVITSSTFVSSSLAGFYGDPNIKMKDIEESGFQPIALPWSIEYGDEFRFEGDERSTFMVGQIYGPNEGSGSRLTPTGSIEVQFDKNLPVSASVDGTPIGNFNLDHFLIRRYVDDPSQIIFEGFRPLNAQGPYILTPEFSTAELNTNIDDVITNLKERGLITGEEGS